QLDGVGILKLVERAHENEGVFDVRLEKVVFRAGYGKVDPMTELVLDPALNAPAQPIEERIRAAVSAGRGRHLLLLLLRETLPLHRPASGSLASAKLRESAAAHVACLLRTEPQDPHVDVERVI